MVVLTSVCPRRRWIVCKSYSARRRWLAYVVPKRMGGNTFRDARTRSRGLNGTLDVGFVKVVAAHFSRLAEEGEIASGEEPLPDVFATSVFVFLLELPRQEHASKSFGQVLGMEPTGLVHLLANLREGTNWQGHSSVFLAFAVVDREEHGIEVETMDTEIHAFGQA